jgi:hypothetical protein
MRKESGSIIYSPSDLIRYLSSPFASWLDRYYLENPEAIAPDKQTEEEELLSRTGDKHEQSILSGYKASTLRFLRPFYARARGMDHPRRVEAARTEFKAKQDRAWGAGRVDRATFEKKELSAWNTFAAQKKACLKDYLRAVETGLVIRRRTGRKCTQCNAANVMGRAKYCELCAKQRHREAVRANKKQSRSFRVISSLSESLQPEALAIA